MTPSPSISLHAVWAVLASVAFAGGYFLAPGERTKPASDGDLGDTAGSGAAPWKSAGNGGAPGRGVGADEASSGLSAVASRTGVAGGSSSEAIAAAIRALRDEVDPIARNRRFAQLLDQLTPENAEAAFAALSEDLDPMNPMNFHHLALLSFAWGQMAPEKALAYASGMDSRGRMFFQASALAGWCGRDPDAAVAWYRAQDLSGPGKNIMAMGMIDALVKSHPEKASDFAQSEPDPDIRARWIEALGRRQIREAGHEGGRAWIDKMLAEGKVDAESLSGPAREVAEKWAAQDPKAAAAWAMGLPEGEARFDAMDSTVRAWGRQDPTAASEYLANLPASETKDRAVQDFARTIAAEDPKAAVTWASSIGDSSRRERTLVRVAQEWNQSDPAAAEAWLQTSDLSEEAKARATREPDRERPWNMLRGRGGPGGGR